MLLLTRWKMWESGAFCPISKRGGKPALGVFHRASFPPCRFWISVRTERSDAAALTAVVISKSAERGKESFDPGR